MDPFSATTRVEWRRAHKEAKYVIPPPLYETFCGLSFVVWEREWGRDGGRNRRERRGERRRREMGSALRHIILLDPLPDLFSGTPSDVRMLTEVEPNKAR